MAAKKKSNPLWKYGKWALIGVVARELYLSLGPRRQNRRDMFNKAQYRAQQTGKKLIVVGDPDGGVVNRLVGRDYDCGDLCIDKVGCLACETYLTSRLEDALPGMEANSAVIYVSATLEYVDDIDQIMTELQRVSGGDTYVVTVEPWTMTSLWYPGGKRQFYKTPTGELAWRPLSVLRLPTGEQQRYKFVTAPVAIASEAQET